MKSGSLPTVDNLRCFVAAAESLNFRRAAASVALSPAALSKRIAALEDELGHQLFRRTTRRVTLTKAGSSLLPYAQRALVAIGDCVEASQGGMPAAPTEITVGTRHELGMSWIVPLLPSIRGAQEGLTVHLYFGSGLDLVHRVARGDLDCAVTSSRIHDPRLIGHELHEERYVMVGSPSLLDQMPLLSRADAKHHTLIDIDPSMPLYAYFRDARSGFASTRFARTLCMGTIAAIRALTLRGEGVSVLPHYFVERDLERERLVHIFPEVEPRSDMFRLVTRGDDPRQPLFEALAELLCNRSLR